MSAAHTDAEIIADLDQAIARMDNSDAGWACVDAMKAARSRLSAAPDLLSALIILLHYDEQDAACVPTTAHLDAQDTARSVIAKATGQ